MNRFVVISIAISILFFGCKPDDPCDPPIMKINEELFDYMPDENYGIVNYSDSIGNINAFALDYYSYHTDYSPNPCNGGAEFLSLTYKSDAAVNRINYHLYASATNLVTIDVGPNGSCQSRFYIITENLENQIDTLNIYGKTYYNAYLRGGGVGNCCRAIYYNKQYGIIAYNWDGTWYVLEKDSLQ